MSDQAGLVLIGIVGLVMGLFVLIGGAMNRDLGAFTNVLTGIVGFAFVGGGAALIVIAAINPPWAVI